MLECTVPVKSKGEVMRFAYSQLAGQGYDAFCVFDADNVAHPDFLKEMNNAYCAGARAAQGYRDSKNPYDSAFSGCYSTSVLFKCFRYKNYVGSFCFYRSKSNFAGNMRKRDKTRCV